MVFVAAAMLVYKLNSTKYTTESINSGIFDYCRNESWVPGDLRVLWYKPGHINGSFSVASGIKRYAAQRNSPYIFHIACANLRIRDLFYIFMWCTVTSHKKAL